MFPGTLTQGGPAQPPQTHTGAFESSRPPASGLFFKLPGGLEAKMENHCPGAGQGQMAELGFRVHSQSPSVSSAGGRQLPPGGQGGLTWLALCPA